MKVPSILIVELSISTCPLYWFNNIILSSISSTDATCSSLVVVQRDGLLFSKLGMQLDLLMSMILSVSQIPILL